MWARIGSNEILRLQPRWIYLMAVVSTDMKINKRKRVLLHVRLALGCLSSYTA